MSEDAGHDEVRRYNDYVTAIGERDRLDQRLAGRTRDERAASIALTNEAALDERRLLDTVRSLDQRIDRLQSRIGRAVAALGLGDAGSVDGAPGVTLTSVAGCERALAEIEADLRSLESGMSWLERNRSSVANSGPPQVAVVPRPGPEPSRPDVVVPRTARPPILVIVLVVAAVAILAVLVLVV